MDQRKLEVEDDVLANQAAHLGTSEIQFQRLVVATDFSKPAKNALALAVTIGRLFGSTLSLVHAITPPLYEVEGVIVPPNILRGDLEAMKGDMQATVAEDPELAALKPKVTVEYASAIDLIQRVAQEERADLILTGSHGASGLERLALGSVAEAVLRKATCPVLIAGPRSKPTKYPFRSIVFATDLKTTGLRGAQYAAGLAERFHSKLMFLHAVDQKRARRGAEPEIVRERSEEKLRQLLPEDIDQYCKAQVRLEHGSAAEVITAATRSEAASLLVVGLRDRAMAHRAPWSTLSQVIREVSCPVLGVRGRLV